MTDARHDDQHEPEQQPLGAFLRRQRELAELTLNQFAGTVGISNAYLSQIERGLRRPSGAVLSAIASGLHLSAEAIESYAPKAEKAVPSKVLAALEGDDQLTGRQRTALAEMYRSFVELNASRRPQRPEENGASA
jgi:transcriptional regulator with XRE-family HTH domain